MKYILDSSVAFKWVVAESLSDKAQLVRDHYRNKIHELLSPDVLPIEIAHTLTVLRTHGSILSIVSPRKARKIRKKDKNAPLSRIKQDFLARVLLLYSFRVFRAFRGERVFS